MIALSFHDHAEVAKLVNAVRELREGNTQNVYLVHPTTQAILQELALVGLGAEPLPEGTLSATDIAHYRERHPKR